MANKKLFKGINTYVLLSTILIIVAILTYIIPAGQYDLIKDEASGREVVDPESFHYVERNPASIFDIFRAIPKGMIDGAKIIFFIFIISGSIQIVRSTGAIDAGILKVVEAFTGRENLFIPVFIILFSLTGAFLGFSEENLIFIPLIISLVKQLGYDTIVAISVSYLATQLGFFAAMMNPFNVGVAHAIAQLPLYSGVGFRFLTWIILLVVTIWYVSSYAEKVRKNPELSLVADVPESETSNLQELDENIKLTKKHKVIYMIFILGFFGIIYGVYKFDWGIVDIAAMFLMMGVMSGFIGGFNPTKIANEFVEGAKSIVFGALMVGFAKAIYIVMNEGLILDTIINVLVTGIEKLPQSISVLGMYAIQWVINILVPSATGQAAISMPIMVPVADMLNINRQVATLAFIFGDGINNSIIPTSSTLLAVLSFANVPYQRWVKYLYKLTIIWTVIGAILLLIANAINLGPF